MLYLAVVRYILNADYKMFRYRFVLLSLIPVHFVSHNVVEIFECHESIVVQICLVDHLIDFLIGDVFSQILSNFFQLQFGEFALC